VVNLEGQGSSHCLFYGTIPAFAWRDWGKPWKSSVRVASCWANI